MSTTRVINLTVAGAAMGIGVAQIVQAYPSGTGAIVVLANGQTETVAEDPATIATAANASGTVLAPVTEADGVSIRYVGVGLVNRVYDNGTGCNVVMNPSSANFVSTDSRATVEAALNA